MAPDIPSTSRRWWAGSTAMTHIAVSQMLDGKVVDWMEHVSDDEYGA